MYLPNKYTRWYNEIIQNAKNRSTISEYTERHHIIPKSLGGSNKKENIAILTAREHFVCHWLLTKMVDKDSLLKMQRAVWRMLVRGSDFQKRYKPNSYTYENLRLKYGFLRKGTVTSKETKEKISKANTGRVAWNKGIPRTKEERELMSKKRKETAAGTQVWNYGKTILQKLLER